MNSYVLSGLADKRAEVVRSIETKREEIEAAKQALQHIDAVLELLDPNNVKRSAPPRSGLSRAVLEIVRTAETPPTAREIAAKVAALRGEPDRARDYLSRTENVLYKQKLRGVLEQVDVGQRGMGWRVMAPGQPTFSPDNEGADRRHKPVGRRCRGRELVWRSDPTPRIG